MLRGVFYRLIKHIGNVGSTLIAIVFEQVKLIQFIVLLGLGIILTVMTSFILLKEDNED